MQCQFGGRAMLRPGRYRIGSKSPEFHNPEREVVLTRGVAVAKRVITNRDRAFTYQELHARNMTHALMYTAPTGRRKVAELVNDSARRLAFGDEAFLKSAKVCHDGDLNLVRILPAEDDLLSAVPRNQRSAQQPAVSWHYDELIAFACLFGARLLTAAEWEIAARSADDDERLFSYSTRSGDVVYYPNYGCYYSAMRATPVLLADIENHFPAEVGRVHAAINRRGIEDMTGLVEEWLDTFVGAVDVNETVDPTGPVSGEFRQSRGGSFFSRIDSTNLSAAFLYDEKSYFNSGRQSHIGGRLAFD